MIFVEEKYITKNGFSYPNNTTAKAILWGIYPIAVYFLAAIFSAFVFVIVLTIHISLSGQVLDFKEYMEYVLSYIGYVLLIQDAIALGATLPIFIVHRKYLPKPEKKNTAGMVALGVVFALGCSAVISILQSVVYDVFLISDGAGAQAQGIIFSMPPWLKIVSAVIFAPVVEEIMMRGILLNRLESRFPKWVAVVVSAALFGAMHLNWTQGIFAGVFGLVLGLLYVRTRSLWLCILAHAANNLWATLLPMVNWSNDFYAFLAEGALAVVSLAIVLVAFFVKRNKTVSND